MSRSVKLLLMAVSALAVVCLWAVLLGLFLHTQITEARTNYAKTVSSSPTEPMRKMPPLPTQAAPPDATPTPTPEPTPPPVYTATLAAVGDIMLHSYQLDNAYNRQTGGYDFDYSFQYIKPYLTQTDMTVGNLETVFGGKETGYTDFPVFNAPDDFAYAIKNAGFNLLTTANNHSNDRREAGIRRTIETLDSLGIGHFGTYASQESRDTVCIREVNGIRFAFLSYTYGTNGITLTEGKDYLCNIISESAIKRDLEAAKALKPDFIIVMPHMGNEYELAPKQTFRDWAYLMLENGADLVLASHPHVLQPVEYVDITEADGTKREGFIAYSMGNFISSQRTLPRDAGVIFQIAFEKTEGQKGMIKEVAYMPTWVKFVNAAGSYDITVLTVYDALLAHKQDLRPKDITRLQSVHSEAARTFLKHDIPLDEMQQIYVIPKTSENTVELVIE